MNRLLIFLVCGVSLFGQGQNPFDRPPADVDKALRERIANFYQLEVDGQYRKAEALVAEDTRDYFYNSAKPKYIKCELAKISYTAGYKQATATVSCERWVNYPGFTDRPLRLPVTSTWKVENGEWFWYKDPEALRRTPFGVLSPPAEGEAKPSGEPAAPLEIPMTVDFALNKVKAETASLAVKPGASAQANFSNTALGMMTLVAAGAPAGVVIKPERLDVKPAEKGVFTVTAGQGAASGTLVFRVEQTGETLSLPLTVN